MKNNPKKKKFWDKIRFKYKLSFLNETTLEEVFVIRVSRLSGIIILAVFIFILISLTSVVIIKTPIRNYLPGYLLSETRVAMIENALKTDSLETQLQMQSRYLNNINAILKGEMEADEIVKPDSLVGETSINLEKSEEMAEFIRNYEETERYNLSSLTSATNIPDDITFYKPVRGIISSPFELNKNHFGIDIAAAVKESVCATLKGTVIYTGFDANAGYVIHIQHKNGFVSIYKHNALLLKKQGEEVEAGEAIAMVGNTGTLSTGIHLHFELWYRGKPVNPQEYINF